MWVDARTVTMALCAALFVAACGGDGKADARPPSPAPSVDASADGSATSRGAETPTPAPPVATTAAATATDTATATATQPPAPTHPPTATPTVTPVFIQTVVPRPTRTPTPVPPTPESLAPVVRMQIPSIGLDAVVESVGQDANGQLGTPKDPAHVAWYPGFKHPGERGNAVFAGLQFADGKPGPFRRLIETKAGDEIVLTLSDGVQFRYLVISSAHYRRSEVPDSEVVYPSYQPPGTQWMTLITDGGDVSGEAATHFDMVLAQRAVPR